MPQPGTDRRLDAQGDKIMARLVYRRIGHREAAQNTMRWEDYTQTAVDPSDDCTIWYVIEGPH